MDSRALKTERTYSIKIPESLKNHIEKLSPKLKRKLNEEIMLTMARIIHESRFDPSEYLSTKED